MRQLHLLILLIALLIIVTSTIADNDDLTVQDGDASSSSSSTESSAAPPLDKDASVLVPEPTPLVATDPKIPVFMEWLADRGVDTDLVSIADTSRGRGLIAKSNIKAKQKIFEIPQSLLVTANYIHKKSSISSFFTTDVHPTDLFAIWLAYNKNNTQSKYAPYFSILPPFMPLPLFFSPTLINETIETELYELANSRRSIAYSSFFHLTEDIRSYIKKADFMWGLSILWSRSFSVAKKELNEQGVLEWKSVPALIPLVDMMNTGNLTELNTKCRTSKSGKTFECIALTNITQGHELLISYGNKTNSQLLHDYGFCLSHNLFDKVLINLPSAKFNKTKGDSHKVSIRKMEVEDALNRAANRQNHDLKFYLTYPQSFTNISEAIPIEALGWARLNVINQVDTDEIVAYDMIKRIHTGTLFSANNELATLKLIAKKCKESLHRYPNSTIEADLQYLTSTDGTDNPPLFWITMIRYFEKSILYDIIEMIEYQLPTLKEAANKETENRKIAQQKQVEEEEAKKAREKAKALEKERKRREEDARMAAKKGDDDEDDWSDIKTDLRL